MLPLLRALTRQPNLSRTIIVLGDDGTEPPRQFRVRPRVLWLAFGSAATLLAVLMTFLLVASPLRVLVFGPDPEALRETARLTSIRASALSDSIRVQQQYLAVLRATLTGEIVSSGEGLLPSSGGDPGEDRPMLEFPVVERTENWADHEAQAPVLSSLDASPAPRATGVADAFLSSLTFPALPPLDGFFARGYDAARGHFGIDLAVAEDTPVRSIGDGYVVFADWTNDGGYVLAVQHSDGFLSIYKHNRRLLKRVGDRVRNRESVALSGNTGEITTGPHLHFELWRNGLAQDPGLYLVGL